MNMLPTEIELEFRCNGCSTDNKEQFVDLVWDFVESQNRQVVLENHYVATMQTNCNCGATIEIEYHIWEYPVGAINTDEIQITNGTKI